MDNGVIGLFPAGACINSSGHLVVAGCDTVKLAHRYSTPLYIIDEQQVRRQCREFKKEFTAAYPGADVAYASKALLNKAVARLIDEEKMCIDVVSGGEMAIALSAGFPAQNIYFHGNNKSRAELEYAFASGIGHIVIDSLMELGVVTELAEKLGNEPEILLRVTPGVDAHTHQHITTGYTGSKFGLTPGDARQAIRLAMGSPGLKLTGLHCHLGSQIHEVEPYRQAIKILFELAREAAHETGFSLDELNLGGGFGVNYMPDDRALRIAEFAQAIAGAITGEVRRLGLPLPHLVVEPGRSIVARAGITLYRAGMIKDIPQAVRYVAVDGGMADNIRPALYGAAYTAVAASRMDEEPDTAFTIAGKFCESGDVVARNVKMASVEPGDIIAVPVTGAYCLPMASNYNGALKPAVIMVKDGRSRLIRRREEPQDLMMLDRDEDYEPCI